MASPFPIPFGPYVLERFVAAGGMAEVFLAKRGDNTIAAPLCVKRMLPEMMKTAEYVTMFKDEARLSQRLVHPNVVRVFDSGEHEGRMYMAMEYIDGMDVGTLQKKLRQRGEMLGIGHALKIGVELCAGLHYAHTLGVALIHRDVSPQNILVSSSGAVKVTDFGIAKAAGRETQTQTGMIKGKVSYMAPEQALGHDIDQRVDQFAAGIVVWEMVTGQRLYAEKTDNLNFEKIIRQPPPKPSSARTGIPPLVDAVILRALAKKPADRYPDCAAFGAALLQALQSLGPSAKSDIGGVMAHVLGLPPKELREASRARPVAAPPPQLTKSGQAAPQPRGRGGLQVTPSIAEAPTALTPRAVQHAEPERLPTNAMTPLPPHHATEASRPAAHAALSGTGDVEGDGDTLYDPSTLPDEDAPPSHDAQATTPGPRPPTSAALRPGATPQRPATAARGAAARPTTDPMLDSAEGATAPLDSQFPPVPSSPSSFAPSSPSPSSQSSSSLSASLSSSMEQAPPGRALSVGAVAGALVVGLALGFGAAKLMSPSSSSAESGCPLSSPAAEVRTKAAALFTQAKEARAVGDNAGADTLAAQSAALSGSAGVELLRAQIATSRGARLEALTHYRCVVALDPGSDEAAAVAKMLGGT